MVDTANEDPLGDFFDSPSRGADAIDNESRQGK
jgi:hypothetical protein